MGITMSSWIQSLADCIRPIDSDHPRWTDSVAPQQSESMELESPPEHTGSCGLSNEFIDLLPKIRFSPVMGSRTGVVCSICLSRFRAKEELRLLPKCKHAYHVCCIDPWLTESNTCPLCRERVRVEDLSKFVFTRGWRISRSTRGADGREDRHCKNRSSLE